MQYGDYRARGSDHPKGRHHQHYCQHIKQNCCKSHDWVPALTIRSIGHATLGNFFFVTIANSKQHIFGVVEITTLFTVILMDMSLYDGIYGAALFAKATKDTFCQIDVIAFGTAGAIFTLVRLDGNGQGRTNCLAELTGNATLFSVRITTQSMQATETWGGRRLFHRVIQRDFSAEKVSPGQAHAFKHL